MLPTELLNFAKQEKSKLTFPLKNGKSDKWLWLVNKKQNSTINLIAFTKNGYAQLLLEKRFFAS